MNATLNQYYDGPEFEFATTRSQFARTSAKRPLTPNIRRRKGTAPKLFNGIHRRRRKKILW